MSYKIQDLQYESSARYSLTNPIKSNGEPSNYYKILLTIARLGHAKKAKILEEAGYSMEYSFTTCSGHIRHMTAEPGGYLSSLFTLFTKAGLAVYSPKTRCWTLGPAFVDYVNTYVNPIK
jgi:hypothetical protein